jgi:hypothetical protein
LKRDHVERALREIALVAALFVAYKAGRLVVADRVAQALDNAWAVWDFERWAHLPSEVAVQRALMPAAREANSYYAYVHFPVTGLVLIWLYARHPAHYLWVRRTLAWLTATALAVHVLMPLAPPRMLEGIGIVDTAKVLGPSVYGPPATDTLANQYAAMPSLHVGWAVMAGLGVIVATRTRWRWLAVLHPVLTVVVVVATGNHYWLDAIVALTLLALVLLILRPWTVWPPSRGNEIAETARTRVPSARGHERDRPGPPGPEEAADAGRAGGRGAAARG